MQKARCHPDKSGLQPFVSVWFQVLFHSPVRGTFHLSLTVLVRYRSPSVFRLRGWTPQIPAVLACTAVLRYQTEVDTFLITGLLPSLVGFPTPFY